MFYVSRRISSIYLAENLDRRVAVHPLGELVGQELVGWSPGFVTVWLGVRRRAVPQLLCPHKDREVWFSMGENHENLFLLRGIATVKPPQRPKRLKSPQGARGGSVRFKRLMRPKPPHRGLCPSGWEPEGGRPSTPGRCVAVFFAALAFSLSANSLLTAAPITSALMLYCSRLRQEPCCPPGPNPPSRGAVSRKCALSAISAHSSSAGSSSSPTDSLILFLFVLFDGRPDNYYGFDDCVRRVERFV
jgi:hypothetical protein